MGKSSAPQVDYAAQAQAQAEANKDSAQYNNNANRVDQVTPLGSSTWTIRPGADPKNPQPGDYIQTTTLSPGQQSLYDAQNQLSNTLASGATAGVGRAVDAMGKPFDTSGLPAMQSAPGIVQTAQPGQGITTAAPTAGPLTTGVSTAGLPQVGGDYGAQRDQVVEALMSRINPDLAVGDERLRTRLLNSGNEVGSTSYNREMELQGRKENDARMGAVLAGGQEQSRLEQLALAGRGALFGEGMANAGLNNTAQGTQFNQGLAGAEFGNRAQAQQFGQEASTDAVINALLGRNATFDNQARAQGISEGAYLRSLPLNEVNSLRTGGQVAMPTFANYYSSGAGAAPVMDAALAQGRSNDAINAQNNASTNAAVGAGAALAGSTAAYWWPALAALSDRRLKTNLKVIGLHPTGVPRYSWDWLDGSGSDTGVIAQDLQAVRPDAVVTFPSGHLGVRYDLIGGR